MVPISSHLAQALADTDKQGTDTTTHIGNDLRHAGGAHPQGRHPNMGAPTTGIVRHSNSILNTCFETDKTTFPPYHVDHSSFPNIHLNWATAPIIPQHTHQLYVLHPLTDTPLDTTAAEDSGADRSVISQAFATELAAHVTPSRWQVIGIDGQYTRTKGTAWLRVRFLGHRIYYPFEVVETLP